MAGKIGIDRSYLSQLETGSREIHKWIADRVEAIAKENRVQVDGWPDLVVEKSTNPHEVQPFREHGGPYWGTTDRCPVISWASAGDKHSFEDIGGDVETIPTDCKDGNCYVLRLEGDSMEPRYYGGDYIVVAPNLEAQNGDLVVAKTKDGEVYFKLYHRTGPHGELIKLTSYNQAYPTLEFPRSALRFCHPVHSVVRKLKRR